MRKRRRRLDLLEEAIASMLKKYIGGFFAALVAKAINKFAKDLALKLAKHFGMDTEELVYEDEFDLFI